MTAQPPLSVLRWTSWLRWLGLTLAGLLAGFVVFLLFGVTLGEFFDENLPPLAFGLVLGAIFGSTFGIAHSRFLRRYVPRIAGWVPATTVAFALAAAEVAVCRIVQEALANAELTEREVLGLIARGHNNAQIASELVISPKTVSNHITNILGKLQVADRAQAIIKAREAGLQSSKINMGCIKSPGNSHPSAGAGDRDSRLHLPRSIVICRSFDLM